MYDVIIIGGGPAGSSSAIRLNRLGHNVLVMEREKFPRPHVGESLVPFCYGHLEDLGVLEELSKTAVRKPGVKFINKDGSYDTTYCFKNLLDGPEYLSFHVLRARFDKQLLDKAKADGADVWEECLVKNVDFIDDDTVEVHYKRNNKEDSVQARFVIDATGQDTFLAKKMRSKDKYEGLDRIAFLNHWQNVKEGTQLEDGLLHLCYLDSSKNGWIGLQAVDVDRISIGVVVDFKSVKEFKAKHTGDSNWKEAFYLQELKETPFTEDLLKGASTIQNLLVVGDYSYINENKFGRNYACIGDSAGFLDPIFATGVYLALNTSDIVSKAIDIRLKKGVDGGMKAMDEAYAHYQGALDMLSKFINNFYDPSFINLAELGEKLDDDNSDHVKHKIAFSIVHFLMGGDFFNEYKRYSDFVDFLKEPKQLARYMHLVMSDPKYKETGCPEPLHKIFPMLKANA